MDYSAATLLPNEISGRNPLEVNYCGWIENEF
jgi:hypothetical protein